MGNARVVQKLKERREGVLTDEQLRQDREAETRREKREVTGLLTDEEVQAIRDDLNSGTRGPVVLKYIRQLLADHDERVKREAALIELLEEAHERERAPVPWNDDGGQA